MRLARHLPMSPMLSLATALVAALCVPAHAAEDGWVSYRDAYRAMVVFEKYGGSKDLLQSRLQVMPHPGGPGASQVTLAGKLTQLNLPLDATGRTALPLLKAAYDENAALVLAGAAGQFAVRPRVSIALRADGVYDTAELRAGCLQALGFARYADRSFTAKQCVAVRFVFMKKGEAPVRLRRADGGSTVLPLVDGVAFEGDTDSAFPTVTYRFGEGGAVQLVTSKAPLAIVPLFE